MLAADAVKESRGETLGESKIEVDADLNMVLFGGSIVVAIALPSAKPLFCTAGKRARCCIFLFFFDLGLLCILECCVSSSDRENLFAQPGNSQA